MSYILDALKKAERERGMQRVPTLSTVHDADAKPSGRAWFYSAAALALLAAAALFLVFGGRGDRPAAESRDYAQKESSPGRPAAGDDTLAPRESGPSSSPWNRQARGRSAMPPEGDGGAPSASPFRNAPGAPQTAGGESTNDGFPPLVSQRTSAPQPPSSVSPGDSVRIPDRSTDKAPKEEVRDGSIDGPDRESVLRQAMEAMDISILLYAENPSDRLVFINGRKYVEGDRVDGRFLLEAITAEGAVLRYEGAHAVLKPKTN